MLGGKTKVWWGQARMFMSIPGLHAWLRDNGTGGETTREVKGLRKQLDKMNCIDGEEKNGGTEGGVWSTSILKKSLGVGRFKWTGHVEGMEEAERLAEKAAEVGSEKSRLRWEDCIERNLE